MTYIPSTSLHRRYRRRAAPPQALDGWLTEAAILVGYGPIGWGYSMIFRKAVDYAFGKEDVIACITQANQAMSGMESDVLAMAKSWNPTGFYSPTDIAVTMTNVMGVVQQALVAVSLAPDSTDTAATDKKQAIDDLQRKINEAGAYTSAQAQAQAKEGVVDAPGFKTWVVSTMAAALSARVTAIVLDCMQSRAEKAIAVFKAAWSKAVAVIKAVVGIAVDVAKGLGNLIVKVPDTVSQLVTFAKWGVILGGAAWIIVKLKNERERGRSP